MRRGPFEPRMGRNMLRSPVVRKGGLAILLIALAIAVAYVAAEAIRRVAGFSAWPIYLLYVLLLPTIGAVVCGLPLMLLNFRLQRERDRLDQLVNGDPVTGVANRRTFFGIAPETLQRARAAGRPVSVMFVHVDAFRSAGNALGPLAGEQLLRLVAEHLRSIAAEAGLPDVLTARIGRDAFATLLVGADPSAAARAAERLCELVRASGTDLDGQELSTTVSVGVTAQRDAEDIDTLVGAADAAARQAMQRGGDTWVFAGAPARVEPVLPRAARVA